MMLWVLIWLSTEWRAFFVPTLEQRKIVVRDWHWEMFPPTSVLGWKREQGDVPGNRAEAMEAAQNATERQMANLNR